MFVREKTIGRYTYLVLVESVREGRRTRQRIIKNLGRKEVVLANGDLERLATSISRFAERSLVISAAAGTGGELTCKRIGGPLLFGRLWERLGLQKVIGDPLAERAFEFPLERAVFVSVLHRLFASGSDRDCDQWMQDYLIPGSEGLSLHHFYRAMAWLGEELEEASQSDRTLVPRCIKDSIEEALFARRRDLFSDLSVVFMDTTSLYFEGEGGSTLGRRGYSKDHRPDLKQMLLCVVIDAEGRPVCTEMWPGNTADVGVLLPVIDRLRSRFGITRVCVVADRGIISQATMAGLEKRGLEYILGARERTDALVRKVVLEDKAGFVPLLIEREQGETQLFVKEVQVAGRRYIVCRNEAEAEKDRGRSAGHRRRPAKSSSPAATRRSSATPPSGAICAPPHIAPSRSTPASSPTRRASTASSSCAPTPSSRPCRRCCAIAICCRSRTCSGAPRPPWRRARSSTRQTPRSAGTCSARSWRWCCKRSSTTAAERPA